jgi:hypothetical protein
MNEGALVAHTWAIGTARLVFTPVSIFFPTGISLIDRNPQ